MAASRPLTFHGFPLATLLFAFGQRVAALTRQRAPPRAVAMADVLDVTVYGGYFNGGLLGQTRLHAANGLTNLVSALLVPVRAETSARF